MSGATVIIPPSAFPETIWRGDKSVARIMSMLPSSNSFVKALDASAGMASTRQNVCVASQNATNRSDCISISADIEPRKLTASVT